MTSSTAVAAGGSPASQLLASLFEPTSGPVATIVKAAVAKTTTAKSTAAKTTAPKKTTTTKKATTTKTSAAKTTAAKTTGYATKLPADYTFLRDAKLSVEEKLSRFIGMLMTKSEQDLLAQMEKMAPGSTANAAGTSGTGAAAAQPKKTGFSLWSLAKAVLPPLNLASQIVGDAKLKQLATQVSGPVLAAAATAVGLPQLAPLAAKLGPSLVGALTKDISGDIATLTGGAATTTAGTATTTSTAAKAASGDGTTSEKAQLMELQRLQDRDKELFTLFSNMLKSMHDARMTSIQNIR